MRPPIQLVYLICFNIFLEKCICKSEHDQVLSITVATQEHVDTVQNLTSHNETELWQPASPIYITTNSEVHLYIQSTSVEFVTELLRKHGITYRTLLENTPALIEMQTKNDSSDPRSGGVFYERYHSLEDIYYWINKTKQDHSDMVKVILIGSSSEKRPLYVLKLSGRRDEVKRAMWIDCGIHADCFGADLNRNFDANWCTKGASDNPCDPTYCGQFPESEPETQAVARFLRSHKDTVKLYLSIHSYSQMLLFPYSCSYDEIPNHNELFEVVKEASTKIRRYYRNNYKYGPGAKTIYLAPGGSDDWAYNFGIKYSFTFELQDRGRYGFLLPPSFIPQACNEALLATKIIALHVIKKLNEELP
uniref:Carboxypeptidase B2 n=1 Tax=Sinocyclocheilus rhinocerous TaxID=307959 RepID=A0A673GXT8_9TELE